MRRLILCADDYAFSPQVSRTILSLAQMEKLNATGCMTAMPNWPADARMLQDAPAGLAVGLHLTLTLERPLTAMPRLAPGGVLPGIDDLRRWARREGLPLAELRREVAAQFDRFEQAMGRPPAFVDAHQHSHTIAGVRDIVLAETARRAPRAWVRNCVDGLSAMAARPFRGKALASAAHSRGMAALAERAGLTANIGFAGHYGFVGDYAALFPAFLRRPGERHLVMCHPGGGDRAGDAIAAARAAEAQALRILPVADLAAANGLMFSA